ncbi:spermidine hydroxycinnamoyltransferase 2-like [Oryza brachyantha]|uniref:spermidine hydroxycinnamoyltransferase 2-like n=1 Tax=Oryza brachyantha TaxID=4533 RepID=UPI001ADD5C14|nr:spermidine hydroxycinnamoyltransferase 2-like [Oryza brachyantha]
MDTPAMVTFTARRSKPEMVTPARPTPRETKTLSDMDDHHAHLVYTPLVEFFRCRAGARAPEDPAKAVKAALAEALVWYYPIAGRLREVTGGKLVVECTAEGVAFVEADADVRLEEFGEPLLPPFPGVPMDELLCDAGDIAVVVAKPIIFLQVTRFKCGGFVMGFHICHCIADGFGMIQFIKAMVDIARGSDEQAPMVLPVWERDLLTAPPSTVVDYPISKSEIKNSTSSIDDDIMLSTPQESMVGNYFLFGPREISVLRSHIIKDDHDLGRTTSRFELLTAVIWRCRTVALGYKPDHRVHFIFIANARSHRGEDCLRIPEGYYGNALTYHIVGATVDELLRNSLAHTVGLIREAKLKTTEEDVRSTVEFMASQRGQRFLSLGFDRAYVVSDFTRLGEDRLDFGWAERIGGGVAKPSFVSYHGRCKLRGSDGIDEEAIAVSMLLPKEAMDRFEKELAVWLKLNKGDGAESAKVF